MFPSFVAEATWQGSKRQFILEVRDGTLEFWEADRNDPDQWRFAVWHPINKRDAAFWTQESLESLWRDALERNQIGRRVDLSDELTFFLRPHYKQHDFLRFQGKHQTVKAKIEYMSWENLFEHPQNFWFHRVEALSFKHYEYDLGSRLYELGIPFVFNPEGQYPGPRKKLHINFMRGNEQELDAINYLIWKLEPQWLEDTLSMSKVEGAGLQLVLRSDKPARAIPGGIDKNWGWQPNEHPRSPLWAEILRYFKPYPDPVFHRDEIDNGTRVFLSDLGPPRDWHPFDYETGRVIEPSQHERMELQLQIRDWLREHAKISDARIQELLL